MKGAQDLTASERRRKHTREWYTMGKDKDTNAHEMFGTLGDRENS